jgi:hypothetical protein
VGIPFRYGFPGLIAQRVGGRLGSVSQAELGQDARDVVLGGAPADVEAIGDVCVRTSFGEEQQHLAFAPG